MNNLRVLALSKSFQDRKLFEDLSFEASSGEKVALIGPSGTGKTTLLNILATFDKPDAGRIVYNGIDLTGEVPQPILAEHRLRLGFIFQEPKLVPDLTAIENVLITFVPRADRQSMMRLKSEAIAIAHKLGVENVLGKKAGSLSTGEKRRIEIVRALVKRPQLLFGDEPTANLDEVAAATVIRTLDEASKSGLLVIFSLHRDPRLASIANLTISLSDSK